MKILELSVVAIYLVGAVTLATRLSRKASGGADSFWSASRNVGYLVNGFAQFSALLSSASFLGFLGLAYKLGWSYTSVVFGLGSALGFILALFLTSGPLRAFCERQGKFTLSSYFETRYGRRVSAASTLIIVVLLSLYLVPQLMGAGLAGKFILGVSYNSAVLICGSCVVAYVLIGGMVAVTWMDFMNSVMMFCCMLLLSVVGIIHFGGVGAITAAAQEVNPHFLNWNPAVSFWSCIGLSLAVMLTILCSPHVVMRVFSARSIREGQAALGVSSLLSMVFHLVGYLGVAAAALILFPELKSIDNTYVVVMERLLPRAVQGLALAAILGAIVSTTDALLLAIGAEFSHNIYRRFIRPEADQASVIRAGRIAMGVVGGVAMGLALLQTQSIGVVVGLVIGGIGATFAVPLLAGIWWPRASERFGLWSMLAGVTTYVFAFFALRGRIPMFSEILFALPVALAAGLIAMAFARKGAAQSA